MHARCRVLIRDTFKNLRPNRELRNRETSEMCFDLLACALLLTRAERGARRSVPLTNPTFTRGFHLSCDVEPSRPMPPCTLGDALDCLAGMPQESSGMAPDSSDDDLTASVTSPPRTCPTVTGLKKRGKQEITGETNSGEVPFKESAVALTEQPSRRSSRRSSGAIAAVEKLRGNAEQLAASTAANAAQKVAPFGGFCWWCFVNAMEHPHDPDLCQAREEPDMSDWRQAVTRVVARFSKASSAAAARIGAKAKARSRVQSMQSDSERKELHRRRVAAQTARVRQLRAAAQERPPPRG